MKENKNLTGATYTHHVPGGLVQGDPDDASSADTLNAGLQIGLVARRALHFIQ